MAGEIRAANCRGEGGGQVCGHHQVAPWQGCLCYARPPDQGSQPPLASAASSSLPSDPAMNWCSALLASSAPELSSCLQRGRQGVVPRVAQLSRVGCCWAEPRTTSPTAARLTTARSRTGHRWCLASAQRLLKAGAARAGAPEAAAAVAQQPLLQVLAGADVPARGCSWGVYWRRTGCGSWGRPVWSLPPRPQAH